MSKLYTYKPVINQFGVVAYLRVPVTQETSYEGMPMMPKISGHTSVFAVRNVDITEDVVRRTIQAAVDRDMAAEQRAAEVADAARLRSTRSALDVLKEHEATTSQTPYQRVLDID